MKVTCISCQWGGVAILSTVPTISHCYRNVRMYFFFLLHIQHKKIKKKSTWHHSILLLFLHWVLVFSLQEEVIIFKFTYISVWIDSSICRQPQITSPNWWNLNPSIKTYILLLQATMWCSSDTQHRWTDNLGYWLFLIHCYHHLRTVLLGFPQLRCAVGPSGEKQSVTAK